MLDFFAFARRNAEDEFNPSQERLEAFQAILALPVETADDAKRRHHLTQPGDREWQDLPVLGGRHPAQPHGPRQGLL